MTFHNKERLYDLACGLDNHQRVRIPDRMVVKFETLSTEELLRLRMKCRVAGIYSVYTERELERIAEEIREIVSMDGERPLRPR